MNSFQKKCFAFNRFCLGLSLIVFWCIFIGMRVALFASSFVTILGILLIIRPRCACIQVTGLVLLFLIALLYNLHGSLISRDPWWPLRLFTAYGGASSCTQLPYVNFPFNPNGMKYHNVTELNVAYSFCTYQDMKWSDNTGYPFKGTSSELVFNAEYSPWYTDCTICSLFKQDYAANPGRGLTNGYTSSSSPVNTRLCPKTIREYNSLGILGRGDYMPSTCLYTFALANKLQWLPEYFPYEAYHPLCVFCPGYLPTESDNVTGIRLFCIWSSLMFIFLLLWSIFTCYESRTKFKIKSQN